MSYNCRDFIEKLLDRNENTRLGSQGGALEILNHPWFSNTDVQRILSLEYFEEANQGQKDVILANPGFNSDYFDMD